MILNLVEPGWLAWLAGFAWLALLAQAQAWEITRNRKKPSGAIMKSCKIRHKRGPISIQIHKKNIRNAMKQL